MAGATSIARVALIAASVLVVASAGTAWAYWTARATVVVVSRDYAGSVALAGALGRRDAVLKRGQSLGWRFRGFREGGFGLATDPPLIGEHECGYYTPGMREQVVIFVLENGGVRCSSTSLR